MASRNLYSPKYDSKGNPKPSIPELTDAVENARLDAEDFARQSQGARDDALAARNSSISARDEAVEAATDLGIIGGVDGTADTKVDSDTLRTADGSDVEAPNHSGEIWYVVGETAYYKSNGTDWTQTGPDLSSASRLTKGSLPKQTIPQSALDAGHIVSVSNTADADVLLTKNFGSVEDAIQSAIDRARNNGGGHVAHDLDFDAAQVTFDPDVHMLRSGAESFGARGWHLPALGAFGDGSADDKAALEQAIKLSNDDGRPVVLSDPHAIKRQVTGPDEHDLYIVATEEGALVSGASNPPSGYDCIEIKGPGIHLEGVTAKGFQRVVHGIPPDNAVNKEVILDNCTFKNNKSPVRMEDTGTDSYPAGSTTDKLKITNCVFEQSVTADVFYKSPQLRNTLIQDNYFMHGGQWSLLLSPAGRSRRGWWTHASWHYESDSPVTV